MVFGLFTENCCSCGSQAGRSSLIQGYVSSAPAQPPSHGMIGEVNWGPCPCYPFHQPRDYGKSLSSSEASPYLHLKKGDPTTTQGWFRGLWGGSQYIKIPGTASEPDSLPVDTAKPIVTHASYDFPEVWSPLSPTHSSVIYSQTVLKGKIPSLLWILWNQ